MVFILATPGLDLQVFLFFFFPSLLASSSLPLGRKARSREIKGIARRPHERQRWAAVLNSPERLFQSERPDQQRQDPQGRGAGRRSLGRIKFSGPKLGEKLYEVNVLDLLFISINTVCEAKCCVAERLWVFFFWKFVMKFL